MQYRKPMQIVQHRCDVVEISRVGIQTSSYILDWLQFPQYTVSYTSQKTVAVIQAGAEKSMYERLNCMRLASANIAHDVAAAVESSTSGKPVQHGPT